MRNRPRRAICGTRSFEISPSVEADRAAVDRVRPGDGIEQRGLARAVGSDQADDRALRHVEADMAVGDDPAIALADVAYFQQRASWPWPSAGVHLMANNRGQRWRTQPSRPVGKNTTTTMISTPRATFCQAKR